MIHNCSCTCCHLSLVCSFLLAPDFVHLVAHFLCYRKLKNPSITAGGRALYMSNKLLAAQYADNLARPIGSLFVRSIELEPGNFVILFDSRVSPRAHYNSILMWMPSLAGVECRFECQRQGRAGRSIHHSQGGICRRHHAYSGAGRMRPCLRRDVSNAMVTSIKIKRIPLHSKDLTRNLILV